MCHGVLCGMIVEIGGAGSSMMMVRAAAVGLLQSWANNIFIILSSLKTMTKKLLVLDAVIATIVSIVGVNLLLAVLPVP
jgi:hypothetical protein